MTAATDQKAKAQNRRAFRHFHKLVDAHPRIVSTGKLYNGRLSIVARWALFLTAALMVVWAVTVFWQSLTEYAHFLSDQRVVSHFVQSYGLLGPLVLAIAQLTQVMIAFIPGHVFLVAAGYVYGLPLGFLMNITFIVAASQLSFLLAQRYGRPIVNRLAKPEQVDKWQAIAEERGFIFFTIAFVLPVFPTDLMNFVAGLTGMSPRKFLAANFLGRLPSAIVLTLIGSHGLEFPDYAWWVIGALVAVLYVSGRLVMLRIERRYSQKERANL